MSQSSGGGKVTGPVSPKPGIPQPEERKGFWSNVGKYTGISAVTALVQKMVTPEVNIGERKVEEGKKLDESQEAVKKKLLDQVQSKKEISLLGKFIEKNAEDIISRTDKYLKEKIAKEQAKEFRELSSFQSAVISGNKEKFNAILDSLERKIIDEGIFPDFDKTQFDKELFKKDPLSFMLFALSENREKTDLSFVIEYIGETDPEFQEAFKELKNKTQDYFYELRKASRDPKDLDYQNDIVRYDELESLQESIHRIYDRGKITNDEMFLLEAEFEEVFGSELHDLESRLTVKESEEFEKIFQRLANTLLINDKDYQEAKSVINNYVYKAGEELNVAHLYFNDPDFRKAYNVLNERMKGIEALLEFGWDERVKESFSISARDFAKGVADETVVSNIMFLTPALILGTALFGTSLSIIAGAPTVLSIAKRAGPAMEKMLIEGGIICDYEAARKDHQIRAPYLQRIFLEGPTSEQKKHALTTLIDNKLLFIEDVEADPGLKTYLEEQDVDLGKLPSFKDYREARLQFRRLMNEAFPAEGLLKDLIADLYEQDLIYQEDFKGWSRDDISKVFPTELTLEQLPTLDDVKAIRNPALFLLKGGLKLTSEQRLEKVIELHQKGVLFKEDIGRLEKSNIATSQELEDFCRKKNIEINLESLPSQDTYYHKTKVSLKRKDDIIREPFLRIINDKNASQAEKLLALKKMHIEGVAFLDDLELEGLDKETISNFRKFVSLTPGEKKAMHVKAKTDVAILEKNEAILKGFLSSTEEKMASLLELDMEGLLSEKHLTMLKKDQETLILYNATFLRKPALATTKLVNSYEHYQFGINDRLTKLQGLVYEAIKQNPGKIAAGLAYTLGGGWMAIGGAALAGDIAGVIWRKDNPVEIVTGPMEGVKNGIDLGVGAVLDVASLFTDIPSKAIHERIMEQLSPDRKIKQALTFVANKAIGTAKWAILGAAVESFIVGWMIPRISEAMGVSFISDWAGPKIGGVLGSFYAGMATDGKVSQIPAGGMARALKFSAVGALIGAAIPVVAAAVIGGLTLAGLIASGVGIGIATGGIGLIVPLILFGVYAGFQIAGLTGKDPEDKFDPVMDDFETPTAYNIEESGVFAL